VIRATPVQPAERVVLNAIRSHQIVILNETHHQPEHRAFGERVVPNLKSLGVKCVAIEASSQEAIDRAVKSGNVRSDTDACCFDPRRAELLRTLIRNKLRIVAFDWLNTDDRAEIERHPEKAQWIRENAMARNIRDGILRAEPKAKILVWVGMGHACKEEIDGEEYMARRLWKLAGIEPYSIYQLSDCGRTSPAYALPVTGIYRLAVHSARRQFSKPIAIQLLKRKTKTPSDNPIYTRMEATGIDTVILHPPMSSDSPTNRPEWLHRTCPCEIRGFASVDGEPGTKLLIQAVPTDGAKDCAPADQVLLNENGQYRLLVRAGGYVVNLWEQSPGQSSSKVAWTTDRLECRTGKPQLLDIRLGRGSAYSRHSLPTG
jgi:hypothetical protein